MVRYCGFRRSSSFALRLPLRGVIFGHLALAVAGLLWVTDASASPATAWRYDFDQQRWSEISSASAPETGVRGYESATVVSSGDKIAVWGSFKDDSGRLSRSGALLSVHSYQWTPMSTENAPAPRVDPKSLFSEERLWIWGGKGESGAPVASGGIYDVTKNSWQTVSELGAPVAAVSHAIRSGDEVLVWGQATPAALETVGARYHLRENRWSTIPSIRTPLPAFTTLNGLVDGKALFWGAQSELGCLASGSYYSFADNSWTPVSSVGAPPGCMSPTVSMFPDGFLSWGGYLIGEDQKLTWMNEGGFYNAKERNWSPMSTDHAPDLGTAVAGNEMQPTRFRSMFAGKRLTFVRVDSDGSDALCRGASYDLEANRWMPFQLKSNLLKKLKGANRASRRLWVGSYGPGSAEKYIIEIDGTTGAVKDCGLVPGVPGADLTRAESLIWTGSEIIVVHAIAHSKSEK